MPWFLPAMAAGATVVLAKKLIARAWNEYYVQYATHDPPGLRTIARFVVDGPEGIAQLDDLLPAIATEVSRELGTVQVSGDAIRARTEDGAVDVVRIAREPASWTVELTRAWTGTYLGEHARRLLERIDQALRDHPGVRGLEWFARQDRRFARPHASPCDPPIAAVR